MREYFQHGHRQGPDGTDSIPTGYRHLVGASGEPAFQNSWANEGGDAEVLQFWIVVGPSRSGVTLADKLASLEIVGSVTGGSYGTVVFTLPDGYRPAKTQYLPGSDSSNNPITWKVESTGDVSVYAASLPAGSVTGTELEDSGVTPGTYGDPTHIGVFTVDVKGRVTVASEVAISAIPDPSGEPDGSWLRTSGGAAVWVATPAVTEGDLDLADVTTANVSTTKHGFTPKLPNDATKYFDGTGAFSVPAGGGGGGSGSVMRCKAYRATSNQTITTATPTVLLFNAEEYDTDAIHDNSTNTSRFVVPTGGAGVWLANATVMWASNSTNDRYVWVAINGSTDRVAVDHKAAKGETESTIAAVVELAVGDYVEFIVYQNSGGNLDIQHIGATKDARRAWGAIARLGS